MILTEDMKDLLTLFGEHRVRYVLVGGFAVNYYGYVRTTQDIDLLVFPSPDNARSVEAALIRFGFGGARIPRSLFEGEGGAVHLGAEPNRIDLLTSLVGVDNRTIFAGAQMVDIDGLEVSIISLDHLIAVKRSSGRIRDLADADELEKVHSTG